LNEIKKNRKETVVDFLFWKNWKNTSNYCLREHDGQGAYIGRDQKGTYPFVTQTYTHSARQFPLYKRALKSKCFLSV